LTDGPFFDKLLPTEGGWLTCPFCRRNRRLKRIFPNEEAARVGLYCRDCKRYVYVRISKGQCFLIAGASKDA
jgi:hypothetical protein